ncbi:AraC family transcriptional regulator [Mucilaginibacter sp.]|jgi:AraC family transcriptional regulator|uniref:AraC family transcriptional regulator n=1 Tax=Mucilaginibacter sp. TaxID=1882438 RepID=UPI0035698EE2
MIQPATTFLGNTKFTKSVKGCMVALTSYTNDTSFEEWHSHENSSISFLLNGFHKEDFLGKTLLRVPGDIKFIPAGEMHRCNDYTPETRKINLDLTDELLKQMEVSEEGVINLIDRSGQPKFTLLKLYHELNDNGSHATASSQLMLYELFHPKSAASKVRGNKAPAWVYVLKQLLHDEWDTSFDLHELSLRLGIHPVTISRYFPQYFASTLGSYMKTIKIDKALGLIKSTNCSLTEIGYMCGFSDQAHFTRTFKELTGFLPKDFRKA